MHAAPRQPFEIRSERMDDQDAIRTVVGEAFAGQQGVAGLVDDLRASAAFVPALSLVATAGGDVLGQVLLTVAALEDADGRSHRALVLSPLSVRPTLQRQGIGGALVRSGLAAADHLGEEVVVLQGSPAFYPRFGFVDSRTLAISMRLPDWAPPEAGMAYALSAYRPSTCGRLVESEPFLVLEQREHPAP